MKEELRKESTFKLLWHLALKYMQSTDNVISIFNINGFVFSRDIFIVERFTSKIWDYGLV